MAELVDRTQKPFRRYFEFKIIVESAIRRTFHRCPYSGLDTLHAIVKTVGGHSMAWQHRRDRNADHYIFCSTAGGLRMEVILCLTADITNQILTHPSFTAVEV